MKKRQTFSLLFSCLLLSGTYGQTKKEQQVLQVMKTATQYMMDVASYKGGFVWSYLPDMSRTWGEMEANRTMAWIQPPGTPAVGHLMLDAYHATHDEYYYQCAEKIANTLIWGQLPCGGWNYMFDFAGENSIRQWYATIGKNAWRLEEFQHYYGNATFDDEGTMQAAKFLLRLYVEKYNPAYRAPLEKTIRFVLESQYPIGGWPQRYPLKHDHPFHGKEDYSSFITLNDDVIPENIDFLMQCYQVLGMQDLKAPIMRALNCVLALQQGAPYAGWADQYTVTDLQPAHARSYEPRSVNTGTTAHMVMKMLDYYRLTGDSKFLSGIPAAIRFLESMKLPESEVKKWRRPVRENTILVPRFIDPESGTPPVRTSQRLECEKRSLLRRPKHRKDHRSLQFGSLYQHRCSERGLCPDVDLVQRGSDKRFSIGAGYLHFSEEVLLSVAPPVWQKRNICRSTDKVAHKRRVLALAYQADFQFL